MQHSSYAVQVGCTMFIFLLQATMPLCRSCTAKPIVTYAVVQLL